MSENLSALSFRKSADKNLFERMVDAADATGTAATPETVRALGEESLFGDALTLGAVSFYDFLKKENAGKKVFVCLKVRFENLVNGRSWFSAKRVNKFAKIEN